VAGYFDAFIDVPKFHDIGIVLHIIMDFDFIRVILVRFRVGKLRINGSVGVCEHKIFSANHEVQIMDAS
jgi:hypothetical protein